jgi:DNA-binding XRE family transcriptional regulator
MKKKYPHAITLEEFAKDFTPEQNMIAEEEEKYYRFITSFKQAREELGLSQQQLAEKARVNRVTLSKVESGLRNATLETLGKLATALDMTLEIQLRPN